MRPITVILLIAALGIAGVTALLAKKVLNRPPPPAAVAEGPARPAPTSQVLVAAKDLAAGTVLKEGDMKWLAWPDEAVDRHYIVKLGGSEEARNAFVGATVRQAFLANEPMLANRVFRQEGAGMMAGILSPGMRAIALQVSAQTQAGGFVLPGDRIDLILTASVRQSGAESEDPLQKAVSLTVASNLRVLAVDQKVDDVQNLPVIGKTVTLEVSPKDAEKILQAEKSGELTLALRSLTPGPGDDEIQPPVQNETVEMPPPPPPRRAQRPAGDFAGPGGGAGVKVYRGSIPSTEGGQ